MLNAFYVNLFFIMALTVVLILWYKARIEKDVTLPIWGLLTITLVITFICILQIQFDDYRKTVLDCYTNYGGCKNTPSQKNIIEDYELDLSKKEIHTKINK